MKNIHYIIFIVLILISCSTPKGMIMPESSGEYIVGTTIFALENSDADELLINGNTKGRRFLVRAWYPAQEAEGQRLPIYTDKESATFADQFNISQNFIKTTRDDNLSFSYQNAPIFEGIEKFPVILFFHGVVSFEKQNLVLMEQLASNGYIVLSLNHPHESLISQFPEGKIVKMKETLNPKKFSFNRLSRNELNDVLEKIEIIKSKKISKDEKISLAKTTYKFYDNTVPYINQRLEDIEYLLQLIDDDRIRFFEGRLDSTKIGSIGHSMGGFVALRLAVENNPLIKASISMDATYAFYSEEDDLAIDIPLLSLHSCDDILPYNRRGNMTGVNSHLTPYENVDYFQVGVEGAAHLDFSDIMFIPIMKYSGLQGSIEPNRMATIINDVSVSFFDEYLLGEYGAFDSIEEGEIPELSFY